MVTETTSSSVRQKKAVRARARLRAMAARSPGGSSPARSPSKNVNLSPGLAYIKNFNPQAEFDLPKEKERESRWARAKKTLVNAQKAIVSRVAGSEVVESEPEPVDELESKLAILEKQLEAQNSQIAQLLGAPVLPPPMPPIIQEAMTAAADLQSDASADRMAAILVLAQVLNEVTLEEGTMLGQALREGGTVKQLAVLLYRYLT